MRTKIFWYKVGKLCSSKATCKPCQHTSIKDIKVNYSVMQIPFIKLLSRGTYNKEAYLGLKINKMIRLNIKRRRSAPTFVVQKHGFKLRSQIPVQWKEIIIKLVWFLKLIYDTYNCRY